jgi:hypothetical protein
MKDKKSKKVVLPKVNPVKVKQLIRDTNTESFWSYLIKSLLFNKSSLRWAATHVSWILLISVLMLIYQLVLLF